MANTNNKLNQLKELHKQEEILYAERNEKYGDSFSKTFKEYGPKVALIRLEDKLNRAKSLMNLGLTGSDGESLVDTLKDLSNYANMTIIELTQGQTSEPAVEAPKKKRNKKERAKKEVKEPKKSKEPKEVKETPETKEGGPLDDLSKKQMFKVISALGGTISPKANREKLMATINEFPKAKVAVAITSVKAEAEPKEEASEESNATEG